MQTLGIMLPKVACVCHSYGKLVCCYQSGLQDKSTAREKDENFVMIGNSICQENIII